MQRFIDNHKPLHVPNEHQREFSNLFSGQRVVGTLKRCPRHPLQHLIVLFQGANGP